MKEENHSQQIPEQVLKEMQESLNILRQKLDPYAVTFTPAERHGMLKMGEKSLAFVEKAHDYIHESPTLAPSYLDLVEFDVDFADSHGLWTILITMRQIEEMLDDTIMSAGSEAFHAALAFYHNVREAAKQDVPGAKAIYEDLKTRFPGEKRRPGGNTAEGEEEA